MHRKRISTGKVRLTLSAPIVNGVLGKWRWIQDVSAMSIQLAVEKVEHKESYSGQKALVRSFPSARPPPSA
ncbi:hypothetical protein AAAC11_00050 [Pseudomonas aeruginosa]|uniref:hypothetical protein n=1 Tax=Pseudomonas aeruginosa TaxID=287 RepID=UPI0030F071D5